MVVVVVAAVVDVVVNPQENNACSGKHMRNTQKPYFLECQTHPQNFGNPKIVPQNNLVKTFKQIKRLFESKQLP